MPSVLDQLGNLTAEELDAVIAKAKALRQFASPGRGGALRAAGSERRGTDPYDFILAVLAQVCQERGLAMVGIEQLKRSRLYTKGFREPIEPVHKYVESFTRGRMWQRTVYRLAYSRMVDRYRWGPNRMLASTSLIPRMLDEMLPGYYAAGLMHVALERMKHNGSSKE